MSLTELQLRSIRPDQAGEKIRDGNGLYGIVRTRQDGVSIKFEWRYRFESKVLTLTCGTWPKDSLATIRRAQRDARALLDIGQDPAAQKRLDKLTKRADQQTKVQEQQQRLDALALQAARLNVTQLFEQWMATDVVKRKDQGAEMRRCFEKDVVPALGQVAAEDVTRAMIVRILDNVTSRGANIVARNLLGDLRQMFNFALKRELVDRNPTDQLKRDDFGRKVERDRNLSMEEIRALTKAIPNARLKKSTEVAIWIMLATGCRVGELTRARWEHVDIDLGIWKIPAENAKNGAPLTVALSDFAQQQFELLKKSSDSSDWCLPNRHDDDHVCIKSLCKQITDRQRTNDAMKHRSKKLTSLALPGGHWTPHDLRRTASTLMAGTLKVQPEVIERCLNHKEQNQMKRIYQRYDYQSEMNAAWGKLGRLLAALIRDDSDNVVPIRSMIA
jgi:integrase